MNPGDVVRGEGGKSWRIGAMLAYQGKEGCRDVRCTRRGGPDGLEWRRCLGWHCALCDEPCSSMGHKDCPKAGDVE